jgi:hypothetical protein
MGMCFSGSPGQLRATELSSRRQTVDSTKPLSLHRRAERPQLRRGRPGGQAGPEQGPRSRRRSRPGQDGSWRSVGGRKELRAQAKMVKPGLVAIPAEPFTAWGRRSTPRPWGSWVSKVGNPSGRPPGLGAGPEFVRAPGGVAGEGLAQGRNAHARTAGRPRAAATGACVVTHARPRHTHLCALAPTHNHAHELPQVLHRQQRLTQRKPPRAHAHSRRPLSLPPAPTPAGPATSCPWPRLP